MRYTRKTKILTATIVALCLCLMASVASAGTYTVTWDDDGDTTVDGDTFCDGTCQPGDVIEFPSGTDSLYLTDLFGTLANPIIIRNVSGSQAVISGTVNSSMYIVDCEHLIIDGDTNSGGETYGIRLTGSTSGGGIRSGGPREDASYVEVHHVQVDNTTYTAINVRVEVGTGGTITGWKIHDCYLLDIGHEGMYLGGTEDLFLEDFEIYNNILNRIGWDGIQLRMAIYGTNSIHDNLVENFGYVQELGHAAGIVCDSPFFGEVYNNKCIITDPQEGGRGDGIVFVRYDALVAEPYAYNNVVDMNGQGRYGMSVLGSGVVGTLYQNTISNTNSDGIYVGGWDGSTGILRDNIICSPGDEYVDCTTGDCTETNNLENACAANNFTDLENDDFSLTDTSPAKDAGSASGYPSTDIIGTVRPQGSDADQGAYEYIVSGSPPPSSDWSRKCELVIQNGQVPGNLSSFPVLITAATLPEEMIDSDHADYAANQAQADGGDLRFFTDSAGSNRLACEIVDFSQGATPTVEIHVKTPSVLGASDTSIWVYYNATGKSQPAADAAYGSEAVWAGHQAAWNFEEADAGNGTVYYDSTANDNDGTLTDADGDSTRETGQIGGAIGFNGDADFINAGNSASLDMGLDDWTMSCWIKIAADTNKSFIEKGATNAGVEGYEFTYNNTTDDLKSFIADGDVTRLTTDSNDALALDDSAWHFVAVTHDRDGNATFYSDSGGSFGADGTESISSFSAEDISNTGQNFEIARWGSTYYAYALDEMRVSNALRSSDWLTATYNNQKDPNAFIVEGAPENTVTTDTTRPTITDMGWWDAGANTCVTDKSITYTASEDVIPLCLICDEELSVEVPGTDSTPDLTVKPGPLTADTGTTVYAGYDNSGATTIIKLNYIVGTGERTTDFQVNATSSFDLGLGSSIAITTITKANPGVATTAAAHGLSTDDYVYFNQLGEMTEIEDNCYQITVIDTTSFSFGVDTSGFTAAETDGGSEECFKADSYMVDPYDNMLNATLPDTDLGSIVITIPYPSTTPKEIGTGETHTSYTAWLAAGSYPVANDNLENTTAIAEAGAVDLSAYDGSSGNEIIINGNGLAWTNDLTFGDYYTISRVIFGSTIVLNTGDTLTMSLIPTGDTLQVATATATVKNVTIGGTFDVDATTTATNVAVSGTVELANGITLTATNCAFAESKATIETAGGTLTDTNCLFSQTFSFYSASDYRLKWNDPCVGAGTTPTDTVDLRGRHVRPPYNIGCYQSQRVFTPWNLPLSTWSP